MQDTKKVRNLPSIVWRLPVFPPRKDYTIVRLQSAKVPNRQAWSTGAVKPNLLGSAASSKNVSLDGESSPDPKVVVVHGTNAVDRGIPTNRFLPACLGR